MTAGRAGLVLLLLALVAPARADEELDAAFSAAADYAFGDRVVALRWIEAEVLQTAHDEVRRRDLEDRLLELLADADASIAARRFACRQLGLVGGTQAAAELAPRLGDPELCADAAAALATIDDDLAAAALRSAFDTAAGACLVEAIHAFAARGGGALALAHLLRRDEPAVRDAALSGLGHLGTLEAAAILRDLAAEPPPGVSPGALADAMLRCADGLLARDTPAAAARLYRHVHRQAGATPHRRVAAIRGLLATRGTYVIEVLTEALEDPVLRPHALAAARTVEGPNLTAALARDLPEAPAAAQGDLLRALGARGDATALPAILARLDDPRRDLADAARDALHELRAPGVDAAIAREIGRAPAAGRAILLEALGARGATGQAGAIAGHLRDPDPAARAAAFTALSRIGGPEALKAVRATLDDPDLHRAAVEALSGWPDDAAAPHLATVMEHGPDPAARSRAVFGYLRLAGLAGLRPPGKTLAMIDRAEAAATGSRHHRAALEVLAGVRDPGALDPAMRRIDDPGLGAAAAATAIAVARHLEGPHRRVAVAALERVASAQPWARGEVLGAIDHLERPLDFVQVWQVAGPYRAADVGGAQILDVPFPPEDDPDGPTVTWRDAWPADAAHPGRIDLAILPDPADCCAYARTVLHADAACSVRLGLASDDGIKAWLNGALVHENDVMRGLAYGSDRIMVDLRPGPNTLLLKISQGGGAWAFACRLRGAEGGPPPAGVCAGHRPLPRDPPADAVVLFDGSADAADAAWRRAAGGPFRWEIEDDAMVVAPGTGDMVSRAVFEDFTLHLEFAVPADTPPGAAGQARGNSGVYLHGAYEVQVLDSGSDRAAVDGCGAIYGLRAPNVSAARRPGRWQAYDIEFIAPRRDDAGATLSDARITVRHNGVLVHEDVRVPGPTGAGGLAPRGPGPILLQDHGHRVRYRNIWVVPHASRDDDAPLLFDGRSLDGWVRRGGAAAWSVEDGAIVGATRPGQPNGFLCTERDYADFALDVEVRVDEALNSGVQVRSRAHPAHRDGRVHGYQVEIDPSPRAWTGGIYDEAGRGWLAPLDEHPRARAAFRPGAWNHLRVIARGDVLRTYVNGVPAALLVDGTSRQGFVGLQVHGVGDRVDPLRVRWRNLRLREIE